MELPEFLTSPNPFIYEEGNYVTLDFETTVLDKGSALNPDNRIVLAVWRCGPRHIRGQAGYQVRWAGEYDLAELVRDIEQADFLIAHNAKFELQWLERCGVDLARVLVWDTMIGEYVIGGNRWVGHQLSLERIAQRRYGEGKISIISKMYKAGLCSTEIPASWLEDYCKRDVQLTERLFRDQLAEQIDLELLPVMYTRCLATPVLADIEKNGMQLDGDLVRTRCDELERELAVQQQVLDRITGGINLNSGPQKQVYLYETLGFEELKHRRGGKWVPIKTPAGAPKTDIDTIMALKVKTAKQKEFIREYETYQGIYTQLSKYLRKFTDCSNDAGGVLHAQFNQTNTKTHRLSSSGVRYSANFQNFPRVFKPLFMARRDGWLVGEADGSQLEFRVAAHLGRDEVAVRDILEGRDVHRATADIIGCSRQDAKAHTFKPLYGGQSGTPEQRAYYAYFRERYTGIANTQDEWVSQVLDDKYLVTEYGLRYYWPSTRMDRSGYVTNTTAICNYPVQGFATAEIIPVALVFFWHRARREQLQMLLVNTVHDSIVAEVPPWEQEQFHDLSKQCLIDDVYQYIGDVYEIQLTVPLGCGVTLGTHWGSKDETQYEADPKLYCPVL